MTPPVFDVKDAETLVRDAASAPSLHNAQPWRFRFLQETGTFELYADRLRAVPLADPDDRALHIGCGAALFNLRVAIAHRGRHPRVDLLPDPSRPDLLATVRPTDRAAPADHGLDALHPDIGRRHTSRYPYADIPVADAAKEAMSEGARAEGALLHFPGPWHVQTLLTLAQDAARDDHDPDRVAELARWTRLGPANSDTAGDGVPEYAFGPRRRTGGAAVRDFAGDRTVADRGSAVFEAAPLLALLGTTGDEPADWLHAGQALEHVLLLVTHHGLVACPTTEALERRELRWAARDPLSAMPYVQMVLRIGHGPTGPTSGRRPVRDVLDIV
ncbi:Acg family FMN-binding oxidoreductase [Streptomyces violascens]|uniref:Acg family FMN-binding oxidoreductase n=1 Tax=Streptomyces violascens TaxID=67381 RepID=UPI0036B5CEF2